MAGEIARAALANLKGGLRARTAPVRAAIVDVLAELEARLDFPDEELGDLGVTRLLEQLEDARAQLERLLAGASYGQRLARGARVASPGPPEYKSREWVRTFRRRLAATK